MAKISVIVPIYGVEKYLKECLDSILNQTLKDLEIILINDGSKDNCPAIVDDYAKKDKRIIAIHKENCGYGKACNLGLDNATGEYIAIVEPDDFIDKNMFKDLYNLAVENQADIVKSPFIENYDTPNYKAQKEINWNRKYDLPEHPFNIKENPLFLYFHPSIWSCIYRREFLNKNNIRFVEAQGAGWTNNPFQVQTLCLADKIVYTPISYYYWRKTNLDGSEDLKDITIPLKRSIEIHNWLQDNDINDNGILACLYKRELTYIDIILQKLTLKNYKECFDTINQILDIMDFDIIKTSEFISQKEKRRYKQLKNCILSRYISLKIKKLRKGIM